jgi:hypothetical protein
MFASWRKALIVAGALVSAGLVAARGEAEGDRPESVQAIRDGFETERTAWQREYTDTTVQLLAHERSDRAAHGGRLSERFAFEAGPGSRFYVSYALPKVPVTEDLHVSLQVRSNRPGAQLLAWVVLPADVDPETKAPSFVLVPGPIFDRPDRWQKLELGEMIPEIEEQARVLRASTRRAVSLKGAYIERVVVNVMGGQGETDVYLDDLEVGPVSRELIAAWEAARSPACPEGDDRPRARKAGAVKDRAESDLPPFRFTRSVFEKLIKDRRTYAYWFPTAVDAPGADPVALRRAGFDGLVTAADPDPRSVERAVKAGMYLLPRLTGATQDDGVQRVLKQISEYPLPRSVPLWSLGEHLGRQRQLEARRREVDRIRDVLTALDDNDDEIRLATGTVDGEFCLYTRSPSDLDVIGVEVPILGTSRNLGEGLQYLNQRHFLTARTNPEALFWAWLPATTAPEVKWNIWGSDDVPPWGIPPVQPAQLRLLTYMALAGGCRGLTFVGDSDLTRPSGEPLLLEMNFLNAEIDLFEEILARNVKPIAAYPVLDPDPMERPTTANVNQKRMPLVKEQGGKQGLHAAAIPLAERKGVLLLVSDFAPEAQWQPGQLAYHDLVITPRVPQGVQFLEVSPGDARFLEQKPDDRVPGGTRVTLPDFGATTLLLCTSDMALCQRIQGYVQRIRPMAAQMAIRQAELQFALVRDGHERLKVDGHILNNEEELKQRHRRGIDGRPTDAEDLLRQAESSIKSARTALEAEDYATAWTDARRAGRPLRYLMYAYWKQAMNEFTKAVDESINGKKPEFAPGQIRPYPKPPVLVTAVSCPPAVSFYTLPQLHIWKDWVKGPEGYRYGPNRVPSGSFDDRDAITDAGWIDVSHEYEGIVKEISVPRRERGPIPRAKRPAKVKTTKGKPEEIRYAEEQVDESDHVLKLSVTPVTPRENEQAEPYFDFPAAAVQTPEIPVGANNLIRISVLVQRRRESVAGKGGVIIRDTIGGEPFQFAASSPIPGYSRVVLYRKAPRGGTFRVMLGLVGYGDVLFDDFRVEIMEDDGPPRDVAPGLVQARPRSGAAPRVPDPRTPAQAGSRPTGRPDPTDPFSPTASDLPPRFVR